MSHQTQPHPQRAFVLSGAFNLLMALIHFDVHELNTTEPQRRDITMTERKKLTVSEILANKGKRQYTEVKTQTVDEARICADAGIDIICARGGDLGRGVRSVAPDTFIIMAIPYGDCVNADEAVRKGFELLNTGADAVYACISPDWVAAMSKQGIPVIGHVGFVPQKLTWFGGYRAVGKTAAEALEVYHDTMAFQDAGAFGVELEVVPHQVATEITKRAKNMAVISMGAGSGCDIQYLFACDILGSHRGHYPRHAKTYCDLASEQDRLHTLSVAAMHTFHAEVQSNEFPAANNIIEADPEQLEAFLRGLD